MRTSIPAFALAALLAGCTGSDSDPVVDTDPIVDTDPGDTDPVDTDTDPGDTDLPLTSFTAVNAIYQQKCGPCHVSQGQAGHDMGSPDVAAAYADSQSPSSQPGITLGAWALNRIQFGAMPLARGCTGDPADDVGNAHCLTQAEQDTVQAWIDDGQQP